MTTIRKSNAAGRSGFWVAGLLFCGAVNAQLKEPIKLDAGSIGG